MNQDTHEWPSEKDKQAVTDLEAKWKEAIAAFNEAVKSAALAPVYLIKVLKLAN